MGQTTMRNIQRRTLEQKEDINLADDAYIRFGGTTDRGSTGDAHFGWDGSNFIMKPSTDDTGSFVIGDGTTDMDVQIFMGDTSNYWLFNVGDQKLYCAATPAGENARTLQFDIEPTGAEIRRGVIQVEMWRSSSFDWAGSPDVAFKSEINSSAANASGGAIRSIDTTARNRGDDMTWIHGIHAGVRNDSGSTCPELIGLSTRVENYGVMATQMMGIDVNMSCENDDGAGAKIGIQVRNTDASARTAVDDVLKISHTSTNGFTNLFNFAAATGDCVAAGSLDDSATADIQCDYRITCVINGTTFYIPGYDTIV